MEDAQSSAVPDVLRAAPAPLRATITDLPADWRATISPRGYEFIIHWETGGREYYETVIKGRPEWPGYASGVTIGCGFDLGYHTLAQFEEQWKSRLGVLDFHRLSEALGFKTTGLDREQKIMRIKALVKSLSDIVTPWDVAIEQFDNGKYPDILRQLYSALDNIDKLHPHCRAALLSLTFNRGPAFCTPGDRFREMREIREAMVTASAEDLALIPALMRSMARIWGKGSSLAARREGEAELFQAGLLAHSQSTLTS